MLLQRSQLVKLMNCSPIGTLRRMLGVSAESLKRVAVPSGLALR